MLGFESLPAESFGFEAGVHGLPVFQKARVWGVLGFGALGFLGSIGLKGLGVQGFRVS